MLLCFLALLSCRLFWHESSWSRLVGTFLASPFCLSLVKPQSMAAEPKPMQLPIPADRFLGSMLDLLIINTRQSIRSVMHDDWYLSSSNASCNIVSLVPRMNFVQAYGNLILNHTTRKWSSWTTSRAYTIIASKQETAMSSSFWKTQEEKQHWK